MKDSEQRISDYVWREDITCVKSFILYHTHICKNVCTNIQKKHIKTHISTYYVICRHTHMQTYYIHIYMHTQKSIKKKYLNP